MKRYWKKLDAFILKKFLTTFIFAMFIIALIACVIDYSEKVDDFVTKKPPLSELVLYFISFVPHITALLFPLFVFISTIFFTSKMAFKTEIIAILASGVSYTRFLRPYVVGGLILGVTSLAANHFIVPIANKQKHEFYVNYIWNNPFKSGRNQHIRLSPTEYVYLQNFDYYYKEITKFTLEKIEDHKVVKKIAAEKAIYDTLTNSWELRRVVTRTFDGINETLKEEPISNIYISLTPEDIITDDEKKETLTTPQLLREIRKQEERGLVSVNGYLFELHKRSSQPFAVLVLCLIGACLASTKVRGGSGFHLAIGIGGCAVYMFFMQFSQTFTLNLNIDPLISIWIPNIIFSIIAYIMYRQKIK